MNPKSKPILFFGTEAFSGRFLEALIREGFNVSGVITKPDTKRGRGQTLASPLVKTIAERHAIPVFQPEKLSDIADTIAAFGDVAGVLVSYGKIIPARIIDLFTPGIINVHPSLLPLYRGPSPIESAITARDSQTGVSIMQLTPQMDAGPVYASATYPLTGTETKSQLYDALGDVAEKLLLETLPVILDGSLSSEPQNDEDATYCQLLTKDAGRLEPAEISAIDAEAKVRAYEGFPRTRLRVAGSELIITKAHVGPQQKTPLDVVFRDGEYLIIDELIAPSGKRMDAEAYLRGYAA